MGLAGFNRRRIMIAEENKKHIETEVEPKKVKTEPKKTEAEPKKVKTEPKKKKQSKKKKE